MLLVLAVLTEALAFLLGCARLSALRSGANGLDAVLRALVLGSEAPVVLRARQCEQRSGEPDVQLHLQREEGSVF